MGQSMSPLSLKGRTAAEMIPEDKLGVIQVRSVWKKWGSAAKNESAYILRGQESSAGSRRENVVTSRPGAYDG